jgi:hypothetical protein
VLLFRMFCFSARFPLWGPCTVLLGFFFILHRQISVVPILKEYHTPCIKLNGVGQDTSARHGTLYCNWVTSMTDLLTACLPTSSVWEELLSGPACRKDGTVFIFFTTLWDKMPFFV